MKIVRRYVYAVVALLALVLPQANDRITHAEPADSFSFPLDSRDWFEGYDVKNPHLKWKSGCYNRAVSELWHAGEDWGVKAGTVVRSVANGTVRYADPRYSYPGRVVIIEHKLSSGEVVYSQYGHLTALSVENGTVVKKGDPIGKVLDQGSNSHLHWEMREFFSGSDICARSVIPGPGYTYPEHPDKEGYLDPSEFIEQYKPSTVKAPTPTPKPVVSYSISVHLGEGSPFPHGEKIPVCYAPSPIIVDGRRVPYQIVISYSANQGAWLKGAETDWGDSRSECSLVPVVSSRGGSVEFAIEAYVDNRWVARGVLNS